MRGSAVLSRPGHARLHHASHFVDTAPQLASATSLNATSAYAMVFNIDLVSANLLACITAADSHGIWPPAQC